MKLSKLEKETIIRFNESEKTAIIETYNLRLKNRLKKLSEEFEEVKYIQEDACSVTYQFPKSLLTIRKPIKCTEEQKKELRERFARGKKENEEHL